MSLPTFAEGCDVAALPEAFPGATQAAAACPLLVVAGEACDAAGSSACTAGFVAAGGTCVVEGSSAFWTGAALGAPAVAGAGEGCVD